MPDVSARLDIMELFSRYLSSIDAQKYNLDAFASIFAENARVKLPNFRESTGLKEVVELHAAVFRKFEYTRNISSDFVFFFSSDEEAHVTCNVLTFYDLYAEGANLSTGIANFSVTATEKGWRIKSLKLNINSVYQLNFLKKS